MKKKELRRFDILLSISIFLLALSVAVTKLFSLDISLAIFNFVVSVIPFLYVIFKSKKLTFYKSNQNFILLCIILVRVITSTFSFINLSSSEIIVQICNDLSLIIILLATFSINNNQNEKYELSLFFKLLIFSAFVYSIYNIVDNLNNFRYFTHIKFRYLISFSSFFNNKNLFGVFIYTALIACDYYIESENVKHKMGIFFIKLFLILNLILTVSRNAIFAYFVYFFLYNILKKKYKKIAMLITIVLILFFMNFMNIQNFIFNFLIRSDSLTSGRTQIWSKCFEYISKRPILGYGELMISNTINNFTGVVSTHNWFIKLLLNGGIINLCCYLTLIINQIHLSIKNMKNNTKFSIIALSSLFSIIAYGIFEEINLFEFGLINVIFTFYFMFIPNILKERGAK